VKVHFAFKTSWTASTVVLHHLTKLFVQFYLVVSFIFIWLYLVLPPAKKH